MVHALCEAHTYNQEFMMHVLLGAHSHYPEVTMCVFLGVLMVVNIHEVCIVGGS